MRREHVVLIGFAPGIDGIFGVAGALKLLQEIWEVLMGRLFKSHIQGDFGNGHKNFEAVVLDGQDRMGRSVLGVSENDGYEFTPLLSFSRHKFINVSVERAPLDGAQSRALRWPEGTEVLWVWGSGRYRGSQDEMRWSRNEQDAVPLFCAGDIGELSARRNSVFNRYFLTYNSGNPRGIVLRHALEPWGPWSDAITIFDPGWGSGPGQPIGAGYG
jgi:Domain of unknown function (DUF4185)